LPIWEAALAQPTNRDGYLPLHRHREVDHAPPTSRRPYALAQEGTWPV